MRLSSRLSPRPATNMFKIPPPQPLASCSPASPSLAVSRFSTTKHRYQRYINPRIIKTSSILCKKRKKTRKRQRATVCSHKLSRVSSGPIRSVSSRKFHLTPLISDRRCVAKPHQTRSARGPRGRRNPLLSPSLSLSPSPRPWPSLSVLHPSPHLASPFPSLVCLTAFCPNNPQ